MKQTYSLCVVAFLFLISTSISAQHKHNQRYHSINGNYYKTFYQANSLSYDLFDDYEYDNRFGSYRFLPTAQSIRYNRVDGLFVGLGSDFTNQHSEILHIGGVEFDGFIGYSTGQKDWQYRAAASKRFGQWLMFGGILTNSSTTDDHWRTGLSENSITSLVAGYDYHDYYKAEGYGVFTELELGKFISIGASYNYTTYSTLQTNTEYSFFGDGNITRINPAIDATTDIATQESIGLKLLLNKKGYTRGIITNKLLVQAELSDAAFNSDFNYNKFEITSLNYIKLDQHTLFKMRLMAGSITGEAPDFKNFALGGIGSLRATGFKFYRGNRMLMSNAEVIFGDLWDYDDGELEIDGLYLTLFLDSGWSDFVSSNSNDPFSGFESFGFNTLTHNIGAGIGTGFVRLEIATPLSGSEGFTSLWVRLNPTF
ncbi:MAG TPA: hypothetical protein DEO59_17370 [Balneola sp.]|jgi:hypothetical protein|nr:hypothetical protein [Balneola sp.]MAO78199.1 hypothetical protein [Balneola sp.]MBF64200.1 hypothetical protein [Balneola sp.]HBZ40153.1 hypothetical protein [Balneola sp.]|tara:strand:- start:11385 stop:12662 length:1278 start_codon:yes stop_codon:yes gene_type:complete